ncbi:MAG: hypothetical protein EXQ96_09845 [Alphaproteobacteria bacterium]|nr:hypothetical protein [Alphaproteobacteria bacterium]
MSRIGIVVVAVLLALGALPASAEPVKYSWRGQGKESFGNSKCSGYTLDFHAKVENGRVSGHWKQVGRLARDFDFPLAPDGTFGGNVDLQGGVMRVKGRISAEAARFDMDGYCIFGGTLKKVE